MKVIFPFFILIFLLFLLSITVTDGQKPADDLNPNAFRSSNVRKIIRKKKGLPEEEEPEESKQPEPSTSSGKNSGKLFSLKNLKKKTETFVQNVKDKKSAIVEKRKNEKKAGASNAESYTGVDFDDGIEDNIFHSVSKAYGKDETTGDRLGRPLKAEEKFDKLGKPTSPSLKNTNDKKVYLLNKNERDELKEKNLKTRIKELDKSAGSFKVVEQKKTDEKPKTPKMSLNMPKQLQKLISKKKPTSKEADSPATTSRNVYPDGKTVLNTKMAAQKSEVDSGSGPSRTGEIGQVPANRLQKIGKDLMEVKDPRSAAVERGVKLAKMENTVAKVHDQAEQFAKTMTKLRAKYE